ncbi:hypothetical protein, partial [Sulfurimonas sp.]|uniref:RCC1 domain-containing protein n=1 Tax=Sulfurimonas sp. TaxID=2022749 RepID=UPI00262D9BD3
DNFTLVETITRDNGKPFDGFGHDVAITHGFIGTNEENTSFILVGSYVLPDYDAATNTTDTKEELGAGFANYYLYKDGTLSAPVVVTVDDSTTLSDHFGSGVALGGNLAVIGSSVRLYSYARGEGNALNARVKIENASAGISGGNVAVNFTGFNNKARNVIVAGRKSFVSNEDSSAYSAYESRLNDNDNLGYSASLSGFEVARGDYANSTLVSNGGAVLVTNAYENITSTTSSAATPPSISEPEYGYGLATDYVDFAFSADDTWKNDITNVLYKAGANAEYVVLGVNDYTITADNNIRLQTAQSTNVALHTPYESHGSLLVKADGYLDDVVIISRVGGGFHAIKAELSSDTDLNENNLDGAVIHIALSNTLEFADTALESANFRLVGAPAGVNIDTVTYSDTTHADVTLAFDGTDFDDNATLGITLNASELNSYEDVLTTNSLQIEAKSGSTTNVTDNNTTHQSSNPLQQHISYVGKYPGMFANEKAFAALKNDGTVVTWGDSDTGGYSNNLNTELINVKAIYSTQYGFAALKNDGSLVTWGRNSSGEDSSSVSGQLINVKAIYSTYLAFAALKNDGTVVTWGDSASGADSSSVSDQLTNIKALYSTSGAFAALKNDGTVVTWGESDIGGDSSNVSDLLTDVKSIYSNGGAFAALKNNGTVVTWGGTNSSSVSEQLTDVKTIYSTYGAFAALKNDGTVVTWGNSNYGGDSSSVHTQLIHIQGIVASGYAFAALKSDGIVIAWGGVDYENHTISTPGILKNIKAIYSNRESFAAIKSNGRVVTWGNSQHGGSTAGVDTQLTNVQKIYASQYAFAALKEDGTVVAWGDSYYGGDSSSVSDKLIDIKSLSASYGDEFVGDFNLTVTDIYDPLQQTLSYPGKYPGMYSNPYAFAVLNDNGTVVTWGDYRYGGDSSSVSDQLTDVKAIYSNSYAFAALKNDSTVVTWGDSNYGGDSSGVSDQLTDIKTIYSTYGAFAALKNDGSVVTWG